MRILKLRSTLSIDDSLIESDDDEEETSDPLENFLAALGLNDYWDLFKKEQMDIEGLDSSSFLLVNFIKLS